MRRLENFCTVLVAMVGCGGGTETPPDAPPDAPRPPPDVLVDAPPLAGGPHYHYVVSREHIPTNNTQARDFGLDLNGDSTIDNQLGMVLGTLSSMGFEIQATTDRLIDTGGLLTLVDLQTADFANTLDAGFTVYDGATPQPLPCTGPSDTICRRHLAGTGAFTVAATSAHDTPLVGKIINGTLTTPPQAGHLRIHIVVWTGPPVPLNLIGARVKVTGMSATAITSAVIAGAVTQAELHTNVIPGMQAGFMASVTADCTNLTSPPGCGCTPGSDGKTALDLFDGGIQGTTKDCAISVAEIEQNSLIQSLLAPDVTINGQQALSVGIKVEAVAATFTP